MTVILSGRFWEGVEGADRGNISIRGGLWDGELNYFYCFIVLNASSPVYTAGIDYNYGAPGSICKSHI